MKDVGMMIRLIERIRIWLIIMIGLEWNWILRLVLMERYICWVIRRNCLKFVCKNGWMNWVGSCLRWIVKFNWIVVLSLFLEEIMIGCLKWFLGISLLIWRKVWIIVICIVVRKLRIGWKMFMIGVFKYMGRRILLGFRYILMRVVCIFMFWLFLLVFVLKVDGSVWCGW